MADRPVQAAPVAPIVPVAPVANHVCPSAGPQIPAANVINVVNVSAGNLKVPEYYTQPIPVAVKAIYDAFGVKFVHVSANGNQYYIYEGALGAVISRLGLYSQ